MGCRECQLIREEEKNNNLICNGCYYAKNPTIGKRVKDLEEKVLSLERRLTWIEKDIEMYIKRKE